MNEEHVTRIRDSFARIEGRAELVALLFYKHLFELAPQLRQFFDGDIEVQSQRFMQMLQTAVLLADAPALLIPTLKSLGRRHALYGVKEEHYRVTGRALLWALGESLGSDLNVRELNAWSAFYEFLSTTMQDGTSLGDMRRQCPPVGAPSSVAASA
jgi:hemoglobin-like flavoprotein